MTNDSTPFRYEFPDTAGYPDGTGYLDEGTTAAHDDVMRAAAADFDRPSAERDSEVMLQDVPAERLYEATVKGQRVGWLQYEDADGRRVLLHTFLEPAFRGNGIATAVIAHALDDVRARGLTITVVCSAVTSFSDFHFGSGAERV